MHDWLPAGDWRKSFSLIRPVVFLLSCFTFIFCAQADAPWTDIDLGTPSLSGSASLTNGQWTVVGGGSDIWSTSDAGNFVSQPMNYDGSISAYISSMDNADPGSGYSKAGLMLRGSTNADAANAYLCVTPGQGVLMQSRTDDGTFTYLSQQANVTAPVWLKLVRVANVFSGYFSLDGTNWNLVGASTTLDVGGNSFIGLAVTSHNDGALETATFTNVTISSGTFGFYREFWTDLTNSGLGTLDILTNTAYNTNWPSSPNPYYTHYFGNFEVEQNLNLSYFGQRVRAFVIPPMSGGYIFGIASDDSSQLLFSPDENPSNAVPIAYESLYVNSEDYAADASQQSAPIYLQAGRRYYVEARMCQVYGGNNLSVRWQLPNNSFEQPLPSTSAAGTFAVPCTGVDQAPGIYSQSANLTVTENLPSTFSVLVTNQATMSYQWYQGTTPVSGATQCVYAIPNTSLSLNSNLYFCVLSNPVGTITSAPVTLTVVADTTPPTITRVVNVGNTNIQLVFSKPVSAAAAIINSNYIFTNGDAVLATALGADNLTVTLTTTSLVYGSNYSIFITNITDLAATPNPVAAGTVISFVASPFTTFDIGSPSPPSTYMVTSNGINITSAGYLIGGFNDQLNLEYQVQTGDFDVSVSLAGLSMSDALATAGLMARATTNANSTYAAALAAPGSSGEFFSYRAGTNSSASNNGYFPANFPNAWLRLSRVGNLFSGFGSYDGTNWTLLGTAIIAMPAQIYLGLATASHNTNQATIAQFQNFGVTSTNSVLATLTNPHESLGPSSRKTGIVFSEIMYKPAARTDSNNLEYVEIYNSNPFIQDISHYQITCADMNYTFPANTIIPGGGFFVVAASPASLANVYGLASNVFGPFSGSLKKAETLELLDEQTNILLTVPYSNVYPWPVAANGTGHSIVLAKPSYGEGDPRAWDISDVVGGSPGQPESFHPDGLRNVVINEFLPHSENAAVPQFIELYNHSTNSVDLSGCILTDDFTTNKFVIPSGTLMGPGGFISFTQAQLNFTLNGGGETLYFIKFDGSRVLDAIQFGAQADGVSFGRWPDGANDFYAFTTNTPSTNNSTILIGDIVINELMYDPMTENDDDQYIELYNKGTNLVNLAGWQFTSGVTFTFPAGTLLAPNGYLVVGRNITNLFSKYTNLNSGNTVGNFSGKLSHSGELVTLAMPKTLNGSTTIYVSEDQLSYGVGGRWGQWSGGGGSSLELIDPRSNHRLAANWADSDDSQKSSWVNIEHTGVLDLGQNYDSSIDYAQVGILDDGECLVDNVQVLDTNGVNYVSNSDFESGLANWSLQGCMVRSSLENTGYQSSQSLHIRASDRFWTGVNSCQVALSNTTLQPGQTATLRFKARWLHGWPEAIMRLNGNWLEATGALPIPSNLGTPGLPNSQFVPNAGPAIYNVTHTPTLPAENQNVVVTVQAHDPDGLQNLTLYYRIDPTTNYIAVPMHDDGTNGDVVADDGVFSATIPGQLAGTITPFYIGAMDNNGAATQFPALRPGNNEPVRECLVRFGDGNPGGSFGIYHLWVSQTNNDRWSGLSDLSNEGNDATFVNNSRVIYNMQGRFAGSPYHQYFDKPDGNLCHYKFIFFDDDQFLGTKDFNKIHQTGAGPGDDVSLQREQIANAFLRALGQPWLYKRYVAVYVNGNRRGTLMEDTQLPNGDIIKEHFPNDSNGFLYKMQPWFEMAPFPNGYSIAFQNESWSTLNQYLTTGGAEKVPAYRYNFEIRHTPDSASDFTNIFSLVTAAGSYGSSNYTANMENVANMENWMRVFAANHAAGNWDAFGGRNGQNLYAYMGTAGTKYTLLMWDFNVVIGNGNSWGPGQGLSEVGYQDPNLALVYQNPAFLRMYWRAMQELTTIGPLNLATSSPLIDSKYNSFIANGYQSENPASNIKPWLSSAQNSITVQLAAINASNFNIDYNTQTTVTNNTAVITGQAPVNVQTVIVNGIAYPLTWTSFTDWAITVPLAYGVNAFVIQGVDKNGQVIGDDVAGTIVTNTGQAESPVGNVAINEIMYNPLEIGGQYVELYNTSSNYTFDLSGWQFQGLSYTFPAGSLLPPNGFLVLAANRTTFAELYGATNVVFDTFTNPLPTSGLTTLALIDPVGSSNVIVAKVQYDSAAPWPTNANGTGSSLQLIDPTQDNWRVGNWTTSPAPLNVSPDAVNTLAQSIDAFPPLWINEVQPQNIEAITNSAGGFTPWIELYNPTTNTVSLGGLYLANSYDNLTNWMFPADATIGPGQFEVIFVDGLTNLSTNTELHAGFSLAPLTGSIALSRIFSNQVQVLDYVSYNGVPAGNSYGSLPDGQSFNRALFTAVTPGTTNNIGSTNAVLYFGRGSVYTQNFDSLPYASATTIQSANPVTINGAVYTPANPVNFGTSVSSGGLGLLSTMVGWYGYGMTAIKLGASAGDQSTGGIISFGNTNASAANRSLGLIATSTTGGTAFGVALQNETTNAFDQINVSFLGELWRQQPATKSLSFGYYIDVSGTNGFTIAGTTPLHNLDVNFLTGTSAALDGTQPANQVNVSVTNQTIAAWPPGAVLWLVWQMTNNAGSSQGIGIDNFNFSANSTLLPPTISLPPQSLTVDSGNNPTFSVVANSVYALTYQWQLNGSNILSATNATLALNDVSLADQGNYDVVVQNAYGSVTSDTAVLTVNVLSGAPVFDFQPLSQTNYFGGTAVFAVGVSGLPPVTYQWLFNGTNLDAATNASLVLTNLDGSAQGTYSVIATDPVGYSNSDNATLTVVAMSPVIQTQPVSQQVIPGKNTSFSVSVTGTAPLTYQWMLGSTPLSDGSFYSGTATATLVVSNVQAAELGNYSVAIYNAAGSVASQSASLTLVTASYVALTNISQVYTQNFDSLPNPGAVTVQAANPLLVGSVSYALTNPVDFAYPVQSANGGFGAAMPGWYASATTLKAGASAGDQSTGGLYSFGPTNALSTNRAVGLITTSTTGPMAFGVRILNQTGNYLTNINLAYAAELWRQQTSAKALAVSYYVDVSGTNVFSAGRVSGVLTNLQVSFATGSSASGTGGPVMNANLGITNYSIVACPPGGALWLVWQMTNTASSSQGLGIDNLTFSANGVAGPSLSIVASHTTAVLKWPAWATNFYLQSSIGDISGASSWNAVTNSQSTNSQNISVAMPLTNTSQFFRLQKY